MSIVRLPKRQPDPRRQGTCPKCYAMQGERCLDRPNTPPRKGVHGERLKANGIDPKTLPPYRGSGSGKKRSRSKSGKTQAPAPRPVQRRTSRTTDATGGLPVVRAPRKPKPTN
ncbi:hypothetical protein OG949_41015 (plasmid) [Streptomyces scopuliridis]|uniref:hypothetical protein n=1 Tax=Streptomyces scopuliridis TaxID=452529 RepID=UPI002DDB387B|nr:hypothetical protein [Streptomyces scopuliridis]WSB39125.1 hypothetical protein OG949_41015 [Streptomyces scopuliridis]